MKQRESFELGIALVILAAVGVLAYRSIDATAATLGWVENTHQILQRLEVASGEYARAVSARRYYILNGDSSQLAELPVLDKKLESALAELRQVLANDPIPLQQAEVLAGLYRERIAGLNAAVEQRRATGVGAEPGQGLELTARIRAVREGIEDFENRLLAARDERTRRDIRRTKLVGILGTGLSLTILALAFRRLREQIARRRESERALKVSKEHVELVNRELEAFNYAVAHDLRAPLRAIDGFSLAILEDSAKHLDEEGLENLGRVRAAAQRMGLLIDGLLGLARVTRAELIREKIDLTRLARQSAALLQEAQPRSGVDVTVEEGLSGEGDIRLVTAVVDNLIGNAWKFTSKSPVTKIEVGKILQDGKPAFFVRDNGAGFDPAYSQKLFGAFQRLHATAEFEGSGIGLATVQRIIHRHGGRIWAEGAVGQGATFFFTL